MGEREEKMDHWEKSLIRENTIRTISTIVKRILKTHGKCSYLEIKQECPEMPPRTRAMVRSIVVNDGVVDEPLEWE